MGEVTLSQSEKLSFWQRVKSRSCLSPGITDLPTKPASYTGKNGEPATVTSKEVKVIWAGSKKVAEVYTVVIRRVLTRKFLGRLQEKIDFLHSEAVPVPLVQMLLKRRAFLSVSPEKLVAMVELLIEIFESRSVALRVLTVNTGILEQPLEMSKHKMHLLSQFGIDRRACIKLATTIGMWNLRTEKYEERLNFLKELGMDAQAMSNVLYRSPLVLSYSKSFLKASVDFLESIGFCGPNLLQFLEAFPTLFCTSVDKCLAVRLKILQDWGFSMNEVILALKQIPQHSAEQVVSQFNLLRDQGFPHDDVSSMLRRQPSLLGYKDLRAKFDFLRQVNWDISEVYKYPRVLAYSLEGRIVPRFKALEAVSLRKKPALSSILACNISLFRRRFKIPASVECI